MKQLTRLAALLLCVCLLCVGVAAAEEGTCGENLTWSFEAGTLTVSGTGPMETFGFNEWDDASWMEFKDSIKVIILEEGVTTVSDYAFWDLENLETVQLPESLTAIGAAAFQWCPSLKDLVLPGNLEVIGRSAFASCKSITMVTIPGSVQTVGESAFSGCTGMIGLVIEAGVQKLDMGAFSFCDKLAKVSLPESLTQVGMSAFNGCQALTEVYYQGTQEQWNAMELEPGNEPLSAASAFFQTGPEQMFSGTCGEDLTWRLDDGTLTVSGSGNMDDYSLEDEVYAPWQSYASAISRVVISSGVGSVGEGALRGYPVLQSVEVLGGGTAIGDYAFADCSELEEIVLHDGVSAIGIGAFESCNALREIEIPGTVALLGSDALSWCESLEAVILHEGVTAIGAQAFSWSRALSYLVIPASMETVGTDAFERCDAFETVYYGGQWGQWESVSVDSGNNELVYADFYYNSTGPEDPDDYIRAGTCGEDLTWTCTAEGVLTITGTGPMRDHSYYSEFNWRDFGHIQDLLKEIVICEGVTSIGSYSFPYSYELEKITIPDTVTSIGHYAFIGCHNLQEVILPDSVTDLGQGAFYECLSLANVQLSAALTDLAQETFYGCASLTQVEFPQGLTSIGICAFKGCENLTTVILPDSVETVEERAFIDLANLTTLDLGKGIQKIGLKAFSGCTGLTEIVIPASVQEAGVETFAGCTGLTSLTIEDGAGAVPDFWGCTGLTSVVIPGSVGSNTGSFSRCTMLTDVTIESGVTAIAETMFSNCTGLVSITLPDTVTVVDNYAFSGCSGLTTIHIPARQLRIGTGAFNNCTSLTDVYLGCTQEEWDNRDDLYDDLAISGLYNEPLFLANIHCAENVHEHAYTSVEQDPTCTEAGFVTYTCDCGHSYTLPGIGALGHDYVNGTCSRCGEADPDYEVPEEPVVNPFTDVPEDQWFFEPVLWAVENKITSGTSATTFAPNATCTRAQVVTFLWRAMGQPEPESEENPFSDVAETDYFYRAVLWAVENGITSGTGGGKFSPNNPCTRDQVVTFLWRTMGKPEPQKQDNPFTDVAEGIYYYQPVLWAVENGITSGTSATTFAPSNPCTRAQVVTFLYRTLKDK